jgi:hypothetical protein
MMFPPKLREFARPAVLMLFLGAFAGAASAADEVVAVKGKQVEVFAVPDNAEPGAMLPVAGLPWTIKEEKNSFFKVAVNGRDGWVDAMQVTVSRSSSDACPQLARVGQVQSAPLAGAPGAARGRCK